eukprot:5360420-Prymnesium_polylepis.2
MRLRSSDGARTARGRPRGTCARQSRAAPPSPERPRPAAVRTMRTPLARRLRAGRAASSESCPDEGPARDRAPPRSG